MAQKKPKMTFMECRHFDTRNGHKYSVTMSHWNSNIFRMVHGKKIYIQTNENEIFVRSKTDKSIIFKKKKKLQQLNVTPTHFPSTRQSPYYEIQDFATRIFHIRSTHCMPWLRFLSISLPQYIVDKLYKLHK
jgi:hypothetical protein